MLAEMTTVSQVRAALPEQIRPAAIALRRLAESVAPLRVAACHNIAVCEPMLDHQGNLLATDIFGWTNNKGDRWWKMRRLALVSPLPAACRYESEPFWCNADGIRTHQPNKFLQALDLSNFEQRSLATAAIVVPVHLPFGQIGAVSFTPIDSEVRDLSALFARHGDMLGLYARTFIASYVHVMCRIQHLPADSRLSKREVECLNWAAAGKTDDEIGMIISRSRATIRFHIHNASLKLDAVNRSQTLFKAAQLGYIGQAA